MPSTEIKHACCQVTSGLGQHGSGFLIASDLVVTCAHVIKDTPPGHGVSVNFGQRLVAGKLERLDHADDWAIIRLYSCLTDIKPLKIVADLPKDRAEWEAFGFPSVAQNEGLLLRGTIHESYGRDSERRSTTVLHCPQLSTSDPHGFSGSPVCVRDHVIGMIRQIIPAPEGAAAQFDILYACPGSVLAAGVGRKVQGTFAVEESLVSRFTGLTGGMPSPAATATVSLLERYLGTRAHPVPFGGRDQDLRDLNDWLDGGRAPILLLVAPTGYGKTALVCHWVESLQERPDLGLVFLPISRRFSMSLEGDVWPALLGRLARLYRVEAPTELTPRVAHTWLAQHLRKPLPDGQRLLLLIDGLDEADGWSWPSGAIPVELPAGHRILVTARERRNDESSRLRSELDLRPALVTTRSLDRLSLSAVTDALSALRSRLGPAGEDPAFARKLYRLSNDGDPLVLELLLDELQTPQGRASLLADSISLKPGLAGLWDRMTNTVERGAFDRESPAWRLAGVLVSAVAPLSRDALMELTGQESASAFDRARAPIQRWLHETPSGYVFSHPRLREFLSEEKLSQKERRFWDQSLLRWCEQRLADAWARQDIDDIPDYVLQGMCVHLARLNSAPERWQRILSADYRRTWDRRPMGIVGLQRDVSSLLQYLQRKLLADPSAHDIAPILPLYLRTWLWLGSIRSQANSLPASLITALVQWGRWTGAHALSHLRLRMQSAPDSSPSSPELALEVVAAAVISLLPDDLLRDGIELAIELMAAASRSTEEIWKVLIPRIAAACPELASTYAKQIPHSGKGIDILFRLAEAMPPNFASASKLLRTEALAALDALDGEQKFNATIHFVDRLLPDRRASYLTEALAYAKSFPAGANNTWRYNALLPLLDPEQQWDVFVQIFKHPPENKLEALTTVGLFAELPGEISAAAMRALLAGPHKSLIFDWLLQFNNSSWEVLERLLPATELRVHEEDLLQYAAERWRTEPNPAPREVFRGHGPAFQQAVVEKVRQVADPRHRERWLVDLADLLPREERLDLVSRALLTARGDWSRRLLNLLLHQMTWVSVEAKEAIVDRMEDRTTALSGYLYLAQQSEGAARKRLLAGADVAMSQVVDLTDAFKAAVDLFACDPSEERWDRLIQTFDSAPEAGQMWRHLLGLVPLVSGTHKRRLQELLIQSLERRSQHRQLREAYFLEDVDDWPADLQERLRSLVQDEGDSGSFIHNVGPRLQALRMRGESAETRQELDELCAVCLRINDAWWRRTSAIPLCGTEAALRRFLVQGQALPRAEDRFQILSSLERQARVRGLGALRNDALDAALRIAEQLLGHPNLLILSYLMHLAPAEVKRKAASEVFEQLCRRLRGAQAALALTGDRSEEEAYYDLGQDAQDVVKRLADELRDLVPGLNAQQAEVLWDLLPADWAGSKQLLLPVLPMARKAVEVQSQLRRAREAPGSRRASLLAALVPAFPEQQRSAIIDEALAAARQGATGGDSRPVVLSLVAPYLSEGGLPVAIELASQTWPGGYNSLHIFLRRIPCVVRLAAMRRLHALAPTAPSANRWEIDRVLGMYVVDPAAAVNFIEWENTQDIEKLDQVLACASRWDDKQLLAALAYLRDQSRVGALPEANQEAEYRLILQRLPKSRGLRRQLLELVHRTLTEHGQNRGKIVHAISLMAPTLRALAGPEGADELVGELLQIEDSWP